MTYTLPTNTTVGYVDMMRWANDAVGGFMSYSILLLVFIVILFGARRYNQGKWSGPLLVSSFVTTMVAGALLSMNILSGAAFWTVAAITLLTYIFSKHS